MRGVGKIRKGEEGLAPTQTTPAQATKCEAAVPMARCSSLVPVSYVVTLRTSKERVLTTTVPSNFTHSPRGKSRGEKKIFPTSFLTQRHWD